MFWNTQSDFDRGRVDGSKVKSAAEAGAEIIGRFLQNEQYVAGYEQGEADRVAGKLDHDEDIDEDSVEEDA